jgi:hypothetical protein
MASLSSPVLTNQQATVGHHRVLVGGLVRHHRGFDPRNDRFSACSLLAMSTTALMMPQS